MKEGDIVVVAFAPEDQGVHVVGGFESEGDAACFITQGVLPEQYTQVAIVPILMAEFVGDSDAEV